MWFIKFRGPGPPVDPPLLQSRDKERYAAFSEKLAVLYGSNTDPLTRSTFLTTNGHGLMISSCGPQWTEWSMAMSIHLPSGYTRTVH